MNKTFLSLKKSMKTIVPIMLIGATILGGCKKESDDPIDTDDDKEIVELSGTISGNRTLSSDTIYRLNGYVRVGEDLTLSGTPSKTGNLTIEAGTLILGDKETKGTLIIHRGSKIFAQGTSDNPIVFTSEKAPGLKNPGDWGGIVICGKATNNFPGGTAELEGGYGAYHGGSDDADNSGVLKYVRIEYAGVPINPNQEVNSLTLGSVGSGTEINHIQCSYGLDDAFEFFGGTVNATHLVAYRGLDDDLDMDNGYRGQIQFALLVKDYNLADQSGSNGLEVDNDGSGSTNTPFTSPSLSNITVIGPKANRETTISLQFQNAFHLRRSNKIKIYNTFATGYPNGLFIDGSNCVSYAQSGDLVVKHSILAGVENWGGNGFGSAGSLNVNATVGTDTLTNQHPTNPRGIPFKTTDASWNIKSWFETAAYGNVFSAKWQNQGIDATIFEAGAPKVTPNAGSSLLTGADFSGTTGFDNSITFIGAFGTNDWTTSWVEWNPASKVYYE
ncbi:MAG: hypothetical protein K1X55_17125 [Chitinophagales bacterium]|nr:hypothetical protein [Chitinophagales bacterium]